MLDAENEIGNYERRAIRPYMALLTIGCIPRPRREAHRLRREFASYHSIRYRWTSLTK